MTNTILIFIVTATVISTIITFAKPAYEWHVKKKYATSISIWLAFILGIVASFSLGFEATAWVKFLIWLALGTGSTIWYDLLEVLKALEIRLANKLEKKDK